MDYKVSEKKILITDDVHPLLIQELSDFGFQVNYIPNISADEVLTIISEYSGLVVRSKLNIDDHFLSVAVKLEFIGRAGAGLDQLDMEVISAKKIKVVNAPEGNRNAVGEHMAGMLLSLLNKLNQGDQQIRLGNWNREENRGFELGTRTVGMIGYGNMGQSFAKMLSGFGCQILAYDIKGSGYGDDFAKEATMDEIFDQTDILSLHVPLTALTHRLVNQEFIKQFRKPFFFLNSARGKIMDTAALIASLESGKMLGAALDVLENEKISAYNEVERQQFERLASLPQVIFSPHVAGWTLESYKRISEVLAIKIKSLY
jgi:D-3-phosphoglycerate dehydrogenase